MALQSIEPDNWLRIANVDSLMLICSDLISALGNSNPVLRGVAFLRVRDKLLFDGIHLNVTSYQTWPKEKNHPTI
jgi:hypothetical protein